MSDKLDSLAILRAKVEGTEIEAGIDFVMAQDHDARVRAVRKSVDFACDKLSRHSDKKQGESEDGLTVQVCNMLTSGGIDAEHDAHNRGHCDISVKARDCFVWLAEAKIHDSYAWLDKGFKQLSTRYSTGVPGQNHGDVLIYCFVKDAKATLEKWRTELTYRNPEVDASKGDLESTLTFGSSHKHAASGLDFHVRHKAVSLYWKPKDKP